MSMLTSAAKQCSSALLSGSFILVKLYLIMFQLALVMTKFSYNVIIFTGCACRFRNNPVGSTQQNCGKTKHLFYEARVLRLKVDCKSLCIGLQKV